MIRRKYRISRRIGEAIFGEEGDAVKSRAYPPGAHGRKGYPKPSDYARQLHEKQKLRFMYNMSEKALGNIYKKSTTSTGNTIANMVAALETRLDAVVYRAGLAPTIHSAAQLVAHRHVLVNGSVVNIRSYHVNKGDVVSIKSASKDAELVIMGLKESSRKIPEYLDLNEEKRSVTLVSVPTSPSEVPYPVLVDYNLVLSYYSA